MRVTTCAVCMIIASCSNRPMPQDPPQAALSNRMELEHPSQNQCPRPVAPGRPAPPPLTASPERVSRCEQHVREGVLSIALQIVALSDRRSDEDKKDGRRCVLEAGESIETCLDQRERDTLGGYMRQRQLDCEKWPEKLAACVLGLPGAKDCDDSEYPLWLEPIDAGKPGPGVGWRTSVHEPESDTVWLAVNRRGIVLMQDADGLRGLCAGDELWRIPPAWLEHFAVGDSVVRVGSEHGLAIYDARTGDSQANVLNDALASGVVVQDDDSLLVMTDRGDVVRVDVAACARGTAACTRVLGTLPEGQRPETALVSWRFDGGWLVADTSAMYVYDDSAALQSTVYLRDSTSWIEPLAPGLLAVADDTGVALLDARACAAQGPELWLPFTAHLDSDVVARSQQPASCSQCDKARAGCIASYRTSLMGDYQYAMPIGGGSVAWNDHGIVPETHYLPSTGEGWQVTSGGRGTVIGDRDNVYVVSLGVSGHGPVSVLAIARATGRTAWQTQLDRAPTGVDQHSDVAIATGARLLAAHVGDRLHVIDMNP